MRIAVAAGALLLLASPPAFSQGDWVDIKDPAELRALYSNKTLKGKDWMDRPWVGHYRADSHGVMLFEGGRYPRTREVSGKDQVCVQTQFDRRCFLFQRHRSKAATFRSINVANDLAVEFVAEEGVPKF
jgi:hypothetical protein